MDVALHKNDVFIKTRFFVVARSFTFLYNTLRKHTLFNTVNVVMQVKQ